jgi:hypothetical protein
MPSAVSAAVPALQLSHVNLHRCKAGLCYHAVSHACVWSPDHPFGAQLTALIALTSAVGALHVDEKLDRPPTCTLVAEPLDAVQHDAQAAGARGVEHQSELGLRLHLRLLLVDLLPQLPRLVRCVPLLTPFHPCRLCLHTGSCAAGADHALQLTPSLHAFCCWLPVSLCCQSCCASSKTRIGCCRQPAFASPYTFACHTGMHACMIRGKRCRPCVLTRQTDSAGHAMQHRIVV